MTFLTADDVFRLPDDGWRYELVRGELRQTPLAGAEHGRITANIISSLAAQVKSAAGELYAPGTGFQIEHNPDTVRAPDVAFVRAERVVRTPRFFEGPPDVAVEVVSPNDSYSEIEEKTLDWLRAGVRVVIIVDPRTKSAHIHRGTEIAPIVKEVIEIDDVVPGWRLPLSEIFD